MWKRIATEACLSIAAFALSACGSEDTGSGDVSFTVWGEEFIEQGIPAEAFEDGWSVEFSKFLIVIGGVVVADRRGDEAGRIEGTQLLNLVTPGPHELGGLEGLEARAWDRVGYGVLAIDAGTELHPSASADDLATMQAGGYSVFVSGRASRENESRTFAWGFSNSTRYGDCVASIDGKETEGIVVTNGGTDDVELTIHGDHFFYDDLASPEAVPRFDGMLAADADADGEVTLDELTAVKLVDLAEGTYGTGSASHVDDLGAFVRELTTTLGHFRGEGHCIARAD